eukprot:m51a1_g7024 putative serine-threonine protein (894) ;mRNA; r:49812-54270
MRSASAAPAPGPLAAACCCLALLLLCCRPCAAARARRPAAPVLCAPLPSLATSSPPAPFASLVAAPSGAERAAAVVAVTIAGATSLAWWRPSSSPSSSRWSAVVASRAQGSGAVVGVDECARVAWNVSAASVGVDVAYTSASASADRLALFHADNAAAAWVYEVVAADDVADAEPPRVRRAATLVLGGVNVTASAWCGAALWVAGADVSPERLGAVVLSFAFGARGSAGDAVQWPAFDTRTNGTSIDLGPAGPLSVQCAGLDPARPGNGDAVVCGARGLCAVVQRAAAGLLPLVGALPALPGAPVWYASSASSGGRTDSVALVSDALETAAAVGVSCHVCDCPLGASCSAEQGCACNATWTPSRLYSDALCLPRRIGELGFCKYLNATYGLRDVVWRVGSAYLRCSSPSSAVEQCLYFHPSEQLPSGPFMRGDCTSRSLIIVGVAIGMGAVVLGVCVAAAVVWRQFRTHAPLYVLLPSQAPLRSPGSADDSGDDEEKWELCSGMRRYACNDPELGVNVEPPELLFGCGKVDAPLAVGQSSTQALRITAPRGDVTLEVLVPQRTHRLQLGVDVRKERLFPNDDVVACAEATAFCTCTVDTELRLLVPGRGYAPVPVHVRSAPSAVIDADEVARGERVAQGSLGAVHKARMRGCDVASKVYDTRLFAEGQSVKSDLVREIDVCTRLRCPQITTYFGRIVSEAQDLGLVMEYVAAGDLSQFLRKRTPLEIRVRIAVDVARAMDYLHKNNFVHQKLQPRKVLITAADPAALVVAKLCGLDTCRLACHRCAPAFVAPEIHQRGAKCSAATDVFSFGVLLWCLWSRAEPFHESTPLAEVAGFISSGRRPELLPSVPAQLADVTRRAWAQDPKSRPLFPFLVDQLEFARVGLAKAAANVV